MGTGSSKERPWSPARRWRAARQGSGGGAPAGQGREEGQAAAPAEAPGSQGDPSPPRDPSPLPPPGGEPDSDAELLDQLLAECRAGCEDDDDGRRQLWPPPEGPPRLDAGDSWPRPAGGDGGGEGGSPRDPEVFLPRSTPESSNFANQHSLKKPERQAKIAYDYSEEELMATIEQEYCR
ncbi:cystin-1 [Pogona vitticeps]